MSFSIYQLKPRFQQLLRPLMQALAAWHIRPNHITLLALLLSLVYGGAVAWQPACRSLWLGLPAFFFARMALNAIDGMLANATGQKTALGALLNELCDQVADAALYLPFALAATVSPPLLVLVVTAGLLAEFAGVLALTVGVARRFDGPMGKSDRAFAFGVLALLVAFDASATWINGLLALALLLSLWTVLNRLRQALRLCAPPTP